MFKKCPHCNQNINNVEVKDLPIHVNMSPKWTGIAYVCPNLNCNAILSVAIDPIAIKTDIINGLFEKLRG